MFAKFKKKFQENFALLVAHHPVLFVTSVDRDAIWDTYLNAFPAEERQEYTCNCCRQFLKPYANVVAIENNKIVSIWNFEAEEPFRSVIQALDKLVTSAPIRDVFVTNEQKLGTDVNRQMLPDGTVIKWEHFYLALPKEFVNRSSSSNEALMGNYRSSKEVFKRSLDEITLESIETVLELISQNSLYRGEESKSLLEMFLTQKKKYVTIPENERDNYCWKNSIGNPIARIRNTAMGTLLVDLSEKRELDAAVSAFERIMAPANYKRPNALITKSMVEAAQKKITELGFENSLGRRFAVVDDITINNVLFANRDSKKVMNVFDELKSEAKVENPSKFSKLEEITMEDFITKVLPNDVSSIQLLPENHHENNLFSLIAPIDSSAPSMLKWNNNFSWAYNNDVTDSIKERVKAAGGNVSGVLRFSIQWNEKGDSRCDLDAHAYEPKGAHIYYSNYKGHRTPKSGMLDVDMIRPSGPGVENINWIDKSKMVYGDYEFIVRNFDSGPNTGFQAQIEFDNQIFNFEYTKKLIGTIKVATVNYSKDGFKLIPTLPADGKTLSKEIWGIKTNQFQEVKMMMYSPNYWDEQTTGNKHYFFVLEGCKNPTTPRGFFNEFLKQDLLEQKRVFEALGSKMKVEPSDNQLSGLGFSSTTHGSVICKVTGKFTRILKINF